MINERPIGDEVGACHAGPPKASFTWPQTYATDWCGQWGTKGAKR